MTTPFDFRPVLFAVFWKSGIALGAALCISRMLRNRSADLRRLVFSTTIVAMFVASAATPMLPRWTAVTPLWFRFQRPATCGVNGEHGVLRPVQRGKQLDHHGQLARELRGAVMNHRAGAGGEHAVGDARRAGSHQQQRTVSGAPPFGHAMTPFLRRVSSISALMSVPCSISRILARSFSMT